MLFNPSPFAAFVVVDNCFMFFPQLILVTSVIKDLANALMINANACQDTEEMERIVKVINFRAVDLND